MSSAMKAKFSSDMDGSSLRVSLFDTAYALVFIFFLSSKEEPKPVKLMLRALPLIQKHVRNILAPNVVLE